MTDSKYQKEADKEFERVVKNMLNTPPKPHKPLKEKPDEFSGKGKGALKRRPLRKP